MRLLEGLVALFLAVVLVVLVFMAFVGTKNCLETSTATTVLGKLVDCAG